jgi:N-acyl-D-aspartate/D-glutamate deacylase
MTVLVQEGMRAGALGLSANRIMSHRSLTGDQVPGTFASELELTLLAKAMGETGTGVFQIIPGGSLILDGVEHDPFNHQDEIAMLARISRFSGRPVTFSLFQIAAEPDEWRTSFEISRRENAAGAQIFPQIGTRQSGLLMSLEGYHAFMRRPTYIGLRSLSATERLQALNRPEIKAAILSETDLADPAPSSMENFIPNYVRTMYDRIFPLGLPINYEPTINQSVSGIAKAAGKSAEYVLYDMLLDCEGTNVIMCGENNYVDFNFDAVREMFLDPLSVHGLSDAGAHVKFTCDASFPTHILSYFVRDRTRGERIPLELAVAKLTSRNAGLYEMNDRGRIAPGLRADLNVIDLGQLRLDLPVMHKDLPLGASRILQASHGYRATFVKGIKTRDRDEYTGERPGRLLSGRAYSA